MVGEGVLLECLAHDEVEEVLVIGRRHCEISHPKMKEFLAQDISAVSTLDGRVAGYNACFFCAGVSSIGKSEEEFYKLTYELTTRFAKSLAEANPDMVFCYISGAGTDSTEKGNTMWARVKGKTENALMKTGFRHAYNFRPGIIQAAPGAKHTLRFYKYVAWIIPLLKAVAPNYVCSLREIGSAMINAARHGYEKHVLEIKDIKALAKRGEVF